MFCCCPLLVAILEECNDRSFGLDFGVCLLSLPGSDSEAKGGIDASCPMIG